MTLAIITTVIFLFILSYIFFGGWLERKWRLDPKRPTPAHSHKDDVDYVPTKLPVVFGHHFASIAGAAPIIGPIAASIFGWIPVLLWIVIGGIFFGSVHDFGALYTSIRHKGNNLGQIIGEHTNKTNKLFFSWFVWLTSILVIAAFTNIVAESFVQMPGAATASALFLLLAVIFGVILKFLRFHILPLTIIALFLMALSIYVGTLYPLVLSKSAWMIVISIYISIAAIVPVWILLQPRDYLNSFLLFTLIIAAAIGLIFINPSLQLPAVTRFRVNNLNLFPLLFVIVACGAISGFHSMFASTTTSKQVDKEKHIRPVAMGSMLVESLLAVFALLVAAHLSQSQFKELYNGGGPIVIFSSGLASILEKMSIPYVFAESFIVLAISSFALTSLDSVARVARSIMQSSIEIKDQSPFLKLAPLLQSKIAATLITVGIGCAAAFAKWQIIWPIFGCANQLIAALALFILFIWFKKTNRAYKLLLFPMIFMFTVTITALVQLSISSFLQKSYPLALLAIVLLALALLYVKQSISFLFSRPEITY